jgi:hypothetical protein
LLRCRASRGQHRDNAQVSEADLIADIQGYFSPTATSKFVPSYPFRILDTRKGDAGGTMPSGGWIWVNYGEGLQVPNSALTAGLYNVTVTNPTGSGHITVFPDGVSQIPTVSNLNYVRGQTVPNAILAPMTDGIQDYYNLGSPTDLIVDFFGYFAKPVATDAPTPLPTPLPATAAEAPSAAGTGDTGRFTTAENRLSGKLAIITRAQFRAVPSSRQVGVPSGRRPAGIAAPVTQHGARTG